MWGCGLRAKDLGFGLIGGVGSECEKVLSSKVFIIEVRVTRGMEFGGLHRFAGLHVALQALVWGDTRSLDYSSYNCYDR